MSLARRRANMDQPVATLIRCIVANSLRRQPASVVEVVCICGIYWTTHLMPKEERSITKTILHRPYHRTPMKCQAATAAPKTKPTRLAMLLLPARRSKTATITGASSVMAAYGQSLQMHLIYSIFPNAETFVQSPPAYTEVIGMPRLHTTATLFMQIPVTLPNLGQGISYLPSTARRCMPSVLT